MGSDLGTEIMTSTEDHEDDIDTGEHGQTLPRMLPDPGAPSRQEVLEHELTHIPFRTWCPHCVAARAKSLRHAIDKWKQDSGLPMIGVDYAFLNKTDSDNAGISTVTTLVAKDNRSKCIFGLPVPRKGVDEQEYGTRLLLKVLGFLGYSRVVMKSDQETAIVRLLEHVRDAKGEDTVQIGLEHSPVHDSQANGVVERAV